MAGKFRRASGYQQDAMNLPVGDLDAVLGFYEAVMGFRVEERTETPVRAAVLARDDVRMRLAENGGDPTQDGCFFEVDDVDAALAELAANGLQKERSDITVEQHGETVWRVFYVVAGDGLCYCLGQRLGTRARRRRAGLEAAGNQDSGSGRRARRPTKKAVNVLLGVSIVAFLVVERRRWPRPVPLDGAREGGRPHREPAQPDHLESRRRGVHALRRHRRRRTRRGQPRRSRGHQRCRGRGDRHRGGCRARHRGAGSNARRSGVGCTRRGRDSAEPPRFHGRRDGARCRRAPRVDERVHGRDVGRGVVGRPRSPRRDDRAAGGSRR